MAPNHGGDPLGSILGPMGSHWVKKMGQNRKKLPCPKIRIFLYPEVIDFSQKLEVTVMASNHGGDTIESILGPMGSHWVQKMGQNHQKLPCLKIWIFEYPVFIGFSQKMEVTVMAPKSRREPLGSILGQMGCHWVQKMSQNRKKLPCPKIRIFDYPAVIDFPIKWKLWLWRQISRVHLGASSHWVQKMCQKKNYHAPKFEFSITPRSSVLRKKMEFTVMAPNHSGDPLGSILGPMGPYWVQKMCQNRKKLPCPKIRIFDYPAVINFSQIMGVTDMAPKRGHHRVHLGANGVPLGPKNGSKPSKITMPQNSNFRLPCCHRFFAKSYCYGAKSRWGPSRVPLGANGVPLGKKTGQNRKKLPCPKIRIFDHPEVIDFFQKMEVTVMAPNHGGDTIESILGPMGSHWVQKMGQNRKKLPCPKVRIFDYPAVIGFSQKMEVMVMAPNHGGDPLGSILGQMGSHWVQKMGQNRKKITMPKNSNCRLPRGHRFFPKNGSYGYGAKSRRGHHRVHLGANGVLLGPKNGSKP